MIESPPCQNNLVIGIKDIMSRLLADLFWLVSCNSQLLFIETDFYIIINADKQV